MFLYKGIYTKKRYSILLFLWMIYVKSLAYHQWSHVHMCCQCSFHCKHFKFLLCVCVKSFLHTLFTLLSLLRASLYFEHKHNFYPLWVVATVHLDSDCAVHKVWKIKPFARTANSIFFSVWENCQRNWRLLHLFQFSKIRCPTCARQIQGGTYLPTFSFISSCFWQLRSYTVI